MIWLAWRRQRLALIVMAGCLLVLGGWMAVVTHSFEAIAHDPGCNPFSCSVGSGWFNRDDQATYIDVLLLIVPCLLGIVLGAPLVAGELQAHTNRLAWTQGVSRSRWLLIKVLVVGVGIIVLVALLQVVAQWWSGHVSIHRFDLPPGDRIQPFLFDTTGVVPVAYSLFALALGTALGALFRRTVWAIVGTVLGYGAAALLMVFSIRPYDLMTPTFLADGTFARSYAAGAQPWTIGFGFRFIPGAKRSGGGSSPDAIASRCLVDTFHCLTAHGVEGGFFQQPAGRYWSLQWDEAAVFLAATLILVAVTFLAVRRWRA